MRAHHRTTCPGNEQTTDTILVIAAARDRGDLRDHPRQVIWASPDVLGCWSERAVRLRNDRKRLEGTTVAAARRPRHLFLG